ncbi:MAG: cold shock domain-containing protein [Pseudomonadota bacterium]|nr:cold shock domain-containing protein [Pseudomonadota bacterium]
MQTTVKKWFKDKNYGFLSNGNGPDIMVRKSNLENCQYLKPGVTVEFECHAEEKGLVAKKVKLLPKSRGQGGNHGNHGNGNHGNNYRQPNDNRNIFGVMT